jgi:hypothetical protein
VLGLVMAGDCSDTWQHPSTNNDWRKTLKGDLPFIQHRSAREAGAG